MNMKFLVAFFALVLVSAKRLPMVKVGSSDLPVNVVIFLKSFFKQIDGQKYFPESYNCMGNMTTVAPTIQSLLSELLSIQSVDDLVKFVQDAVKEAPAILKAYSACSGMDAEIDEKLKEIEAALTDAEFMQKVTDNVVANLATVYANLNTIVEDLKSTLFAKAGRDTADLVKFVFFL